MKKQANETPTFEIIPGTDRGPDALPIPVPGAGRVVGGLGLAKIGGIIPQTIDDAIRIATGVKKSGLAPKGLNSVEAITTVILQGLECGLPPMMALSKIAVINGRPTLWGDALPALLWSRGFSLEESGDDTSATCTVIRPTGQKVTRSFTAADAKKAGLWGKSGPWTLYPARMMQMRARAFACRDGAADVLGGMYVAEEIMGGELVEVAEDGHSPAFKRKSSAEGKRDGTNLKLNDIRERIMGAEDMAALHAIREESMSDQRVPWADMPSRWANLLEEDFATRAKLDFGLDVEPWQYEQSDFEGGE
jgi:hypothetical protein